MEARETSVKAELGRLMLATHKILLGPDVARESLGDTAFVVDDLTRKNPDDVSEQSEKSARASSPWKRARPPCHKRA